MTTAFLAESMRAHGYRVTEGPAAPITGGAADSRLTQPGDLFAAFRGERLDGNDFVDEALERGAPAAVCERAPEGDWRDRTVAVVGDTRTAMAELARDWLRTCDVRVAGITGTVGKTTAKELTTAALGSRFATHHSPGNLNSREGLPLALMSLRRDHEVSVLEMAMDSEGEIAELCAIAEPSVGAVLNIGATHLEKLGSMEAIEREKLSLARSLPRDGTAVVNVDDERIAPVVDELRCDVIGFGASDAARLRRGDVRDLGLEGSGFRVSYEGEEADVRLHVPGAHLAQGALAAIGIQLALGVELAEAADAVSGAEIDGRLRVRRSPSGARILDDTYNASPASVAGALELLRGLGERRIALLGEMAELGDRSDPEHRRIGAIAARCCDVLVAVGEPCRLTVEAALANGLAESHWFAAKDEAAAFVAGLLGEGDHVLVKASRGQAFEELLPVLEGQA
ncbi:MAG: UDP-N-acetylmuramoyl-tripeptide--D-alanyl-D-alanine ligase [Chloroflexota bacterium]|nr:UDP-N-acetylmuramoyl-tripeptide--D-alanyl-D-alanine ligase [Chloroflexota bacterium]